MQDFVILGAMKGRFISDNGNLYDNFQMMGYVTAVGPTEAVTQFFDQTPYPIRWEDVEYMWALRLAEADTSAPYGEYPRVYVESLRRRWDPDSET